MKPFAAMRLRNAGDPDPYFSSVSLLLHGDGANGSTTIVDSSSSHRTATVFGNAQISTAQSKFGGASIAFDGSGDAVLYAYSSGLYLPADFTLEGFIRILSTPTNQVIMNLGGGTSIAWPSYFVVFDGLNINFAGSSTNAGIDIGSETGATGRLGTIATGAWYHFAVSRVGTSIKGFINGVQGFSLTSSLTPYDPATRGLVVGGTFSGTWGSGTPVGTINGYLDDVRITKGVGRYTGAFTPPSAPFPNF